MMRLAILLVAGTGLAHVATANVSHTLKFKVDGLVIVWAGETDGIASNSAPAQAGTSVEISSAAAPVITGALIAENRPRFIPISTSNATGLSFSVASNTAFSIDAELVNADQFSTEELANTAFDLSAQWAGPKAQFPHSTGQDGGFDPTVQTLADITRRTTVFRGDQRTAASPGTITEQSVRFQMRYATGQPSAARPDPVVILTVFVP